MGQIVSQAAMEAASRKPESLDCQAGVRGYLVCNLGLPDWNLHPVRVTYVALHHKLHCVAQI